MSVHGGLRSWHTMVPGMRTDTVSAAANMEKTYTITASVPSPAGKCITVTCLLPRTSEHGSSKEWDKRAAIHPTAYPVYVTVSCKQWIAGSPGSLSIKTVVLLLLKSSPVRGCHGKGKNSCPWRQCTCTCLQLTGMWSGSLRGACTKFQLYL